MIEETIRASGKFQVEIKSDYRLDLNREHTAYSIETYAFVPNSLDVNQDTYPKYLFYRDTQTYFRCRIPIILLQDIAADGSTTFDLLQKSMQGVAGGGSAAVLRDCENQVRLFCCTLKYSIKYHVELIKAAATPADAGHLAKYFHTNIMAILRRFRKAGKKAGLSSMDKRIRSIYAYADEYISIFVSQYAFDILEATRAFSGDNTKGYRQLLLDLVREEDAYRAATGYPSEVAAGTDNEAFIYRRGVLKRMMESILFLDTTVRAEGRITEQIVFSLAAGVAMMFATAVAFVSQQKYGNFTMAFFVALVISYMFKDRIKELARLYFNKKVQGTILTGKGGSTEVSVSAGWVTPGRASCSCPKAT